MSDEAPSTKQDVVFVHSPSPDGNGFRVVRKREDTIEVGEIRALEHGRPIQGEVVALTQRKEHEQLFDVNVVVPRAKVPGAHHGPAQVATEAYRENWEAIFGPAHPEAKQLN